MNILVTGANGQLGNEMRIISQQSSDHYIFADGGISILDTSLGIEWHIPTDKALLSEKDLKHALLKDFDSPFSIEMNLYPEFEK